MSKPNSAGWTLALTSVGFFMVALDALVVTTALPVMGHDLHTGMPTLQWTVTPPPPDCLCSACSPH